MMMMMMMMMMMKIMMMKLYDKNKIEIRSEFFEGIHLAGIAIGRPLTYHESPGNQSVSH